MNRWANFNVAFAYHNVSTNTWSDADMLATSLRAADLSPQICRGVADVIASLTLDEVRKAAADWLAREPLVAVAMPATPAPQAAR